LSALLPHVIETLSHPVTRADVYDLEQAVQQQASEDLFTSVFDGAVLLDDLLTDYFLRNLHGRLYGDIWSWGGRWRQHEVNIGVAPEQIAVELRNTFDSIRYRWQHTDDWTPRQLGIAVHAETVRVHPFTDGNGRSTRLLADLVFMAAQDPIELQYDWDLDKRRYIDLLRKFDKHRDAADLAAFIGVQGIDD